jgi:hypothetical protein
MQSLQRCDLLPGAPGTFHPASKHAVKGLTKTEAPEAAGNQVAGHIDRLASNASSQFTKGEVWLVGPPYL